MLSYVRTTAVQTKLKFDIYNNIEMGHFSTDLQEPLKQNKNHKKFNLNIFSQNLQWCVSISQFR